VGKGLLVAEAAAELVLLRGAADRPEEGEVVDSRQLVLRETEHLTEANGDQAAAEGVLHRFADREVGGEGEGGDQLGEADAAFKVG
jgi:hypothetical protein